MKKSLLSLLAVIALCSTVTHGYSLPRFNLSSLSTPEAVSQAIEKLASVFNFLSAKTLKTMERKQHDKLEYEIEQLKNNPKNASPAKVGAHALLQGVAVLVGSEKQ